MKKKTTQNRTARDKSTSQPKFPYSNTPGALRKFLAQVPKRPKPEKINAATLKSWGLRNTNDASIIRVLKTLDLVSPNSEPTEDYVRFMHSQTGPSILAVKIRKVYAKLFEQSLAPHKEPHEELRNLFNIHSGGSEAVINFQIQTFKALCDYANLDAATTADRSNGAGPITGGQPVSPAATAAGAPIFHVDLHIHLPENKTRRDYEYMFEDIARYIYRQENQSSFRWSRVALSLRFATRFRNYIRNTRLGACPLGSFESPTLSLRSKSLWSACAI